MCRNASKPCAIIISNGQAKITELPDFGETVIVTHQAKVKRVKFDEGEEF
ncbi:XtrA/YqaO family protein [Desulfuribacillus stibiiarsenatis]